ncbi:Pecanex-like protein 4 [Portunus trituberculatus]|uniref:Pecanex-like protein n=1 Tax=Portunus trituberculatus TaxID=210409 RepID=A0A5B7I1C1_PORTR|nr:Pecanex-like protein 4 [Portunus trituberculatus]
MLGFQLRRSRFERVYTSHLLTLGEAEVRVGQLGGETVRGLWASLVVELLYLTNDDDERYSIQVCHDHVKTHIYVIIIAILKSCCNKHTHLFLYDDIKSLFKCPCNHEIPLNTLITSIRACYIWLG